jgi:hypothetical protein
MEETAEPRGLNELSQVPTGGKRKEYQHKDNQPRSKKRKKMKYETLEEDWGQGAGEDLERLEMEDSARRKFLMDGKMDKLAGSKSRQTTIRVWTMEESLCRKILENLMEETIRKSTFMDNLQEDLEVAWLSRQEPLHADNPEGLKEKEPDVPDGRKLGEDQDQDGEKKKTSPEGWKGDEPEEERRARTTGSTHHHTSQEVKKTIPSGRKSKKIPELFRSQEKKNMERDMDKLEKEARLEMKRRLEGTWRWKKSHYDHLRWARELLTEQILDQVLEEGNEPETGPEGRKGDQPEEVRHARTTGGTFHLTSQVVKETLPEGVKGLEEQKPQDDEKEISTEGWIKSKKFQNKVRTPFHGRRKINFQKKKEIKI